MNEINTKDKIDQDRGHLSLEKNPVVKQSKFISPSLSGVKAVLFDCDGVICPPMKFASLLEREHQITREMRATF